MYVCMLMFGLYDYSIYIDIYISVNINGLL